MTDACSQWNEQEIAELRKVFYAQAYEIVEELQDSMLKLEAGPGSDEVIKTSNGTCTRSRETPIPSGSCPSGRSATAWKT